MLEKRAKETHRVIQVRDRYCNVIYCSMLFHRYDQVLEWLAEAYFEAPE